MNRSQRLLIVLSLAGLAVATPLYCLEYRSFDYWANHGRLWGDGTLSENFLARPADPLIELSAMELLRPTRTDAGVVRVTGLYPRRGLTFQVAGIGGLLAPIVLLITAGYMALAGNRGLQSSPGANAGRKSWPHGDDRRPGVAKEFTTDTATEGSTDAARPAPLMTVSEPPPVRAYEGSEVDFLYVLAALGGIMTPALWVIDTPSMLLMMHGRLPRWVFLMLVIRLLGGR